MPTQSSPIIVLPFAIVSEYEQKRIDLRKEALREFGFLRSDEEEAKRPTSPKKLDKSLFRAKSIRGKRKDDPKVMPAMPFRVMVLTIYLTS